MTTKTQYALITGGTSGIGLELAKLFIKDGYNLIIVARDTNELEQAKSTLSNGSASKVITISKDLFQKDAGNDVYNQVKGMGIDVDVLVNNAGQGVYGTFVENDIERELNIIRLNICSVVVLTKHFLKDMVARGSGKILNTTSIAGKTPGPLQAVYHATKAFAHSFTEAIREETKDTGVTITSLLPGVTDTDFFRKAGMLESKAVQGKMADPADVAADGYKALMNGDDMVVSGMSNKIQVAIGNIIPDSVIAKKVHKQQEPVDKESK